MNKIIIRQFFFNKSDIIILINNLKFIYFNSYLFVLFRILCFFILVKKMLILKTGTMFYKWSEVFSIIKSPFVFKVSKNQFTTIKMHYCFFLCVPYTVTYQLSFFKKLFLFDFLYKINAYIQVYSQEFFLLKK